MAQSDPNRILRLLPLGVGALGGTLLVVNRLFTPELVASQSRSDALGVILSAVLILTGLLWQRVQPRSPDAVVLEGAEGFELSPLLSESLKIELAWATHILLTNTVTGSIVVYCQGETLLRRGILAPDGTVKPGTIVQRVLDKQKAVYLVDLKVYPGRVEFTYLPENTQGVICQPIGKEGVLILGASAPRSYTKQDEAWIEAIANKIADTLEEELTTIKPPVAAPTDEQ
jgi:hypothetical protein